MSEKIYTREEVQGIADSIRRQILGIALKTGGCYLAQACSSAEIIAALYTRILNLGPSAGLWDAIPFPGVPGPDNMDYPRGSAYHGIPAPDKDRFFVSCCHYASVIYCALAATGRLSPGALEKFNVDGWNMEMIGAEHSPGFENTAGSLGQTVSIAAGTAQARKWKGDTGLVYCLMGDGELQEGQPLAVICRTKGYTGIPPLKKRWPYLHFVRISETERPKYQKIYDEMGENAGEDGKEYA